ncbi:nuclear RNA export factor 1-like protein [Dinothrombium tinctorium]|uniref:Nuclear RNA export factor 1-like protein n=1 Tax=Dinothrombium tinctorium TaxID=1965070 RepID=A0A3S3P2L8_9ACAR|nr:nuclear RNA export factor 1-like protein [Dinothrombium tinctorium]RWS05367.1 nuclear RNA export factor 1-like protein [Dinothrombium tinctorium]
MSNERSERFRNQKRPDLRTKFNTGGQFNRNNRFSYNKNQNRGRTVYFNNANNDFRRGGHRNNRVGRYNANRNEDDLENQWYKVTIPHGCKSTKDFLLNSLQSMCEKPFVPFNYHNDGQSVVFYVMGQDTSESLKACSRRITNPNGFKYTIISSRAPFPSTQLDSSTINHLKEAMSRRYDGNRKILDISKFRADSYLLEQGLFIPLNRTNMLIAIIRIIKENIPDLISLNIADNKLSILEPFKSITDTCKLLKAVDLSNNQIRHMSEIENLKGLELEQLLLRGNPCASSYKDHTSYISSVRAVFPKILKLDNEDLPPPIGFDVGESSKLVSSLGSHIPPETNEFVVGFINQYFAIYDSDDRQPLLEAYHDQALFSFTISSNKNQVYFPSHMFQESRNLLKVRDANSKCKLLQQGKANIVSTLCGFPKTKHELDSFLIDVYLCSQNLINIVINGVYREISKKNGVQTRAFCRSFLIIPNLIINDLLFLTNATVEQIQKYGKSSMETPATNKMEEQPITMTVNGDTPTSNSMYMNKANMVKKFSEATGMNEGFSMQCLEEFSYNLETAMDAFHKLNQNGEIPAEAFQA